MYTINPNDLKKDLNNYNLALLFNRRRAQEIRRQAAERIHQFANQELWLEEKNCELMYSYIKTFGYLAHRKVSRDAFSAFECLSRIATYEHPKLSWQLKAKPYNIASFWSRNIARLLGRYDRIIYKTPSAKKEIAEQTLTTPKPIPVKEEVQEIKKLERQEIQGIKIQETQRIKEQEETKENEETAPKFKLSAKDRRRLERIRRRGQLKEQKQKLIERQKAEKNRARRKKEAAQALSIATTASKISSAPKPTPIHKDKRAGFFKRNKNKIINSILGVAAFIGSVAGISVLSDGIKQINTHKQSRENAKSRIENITKIQDKIDSIKRVAIPSPKPVYKNYYDSALKIHLGETRRDKLYDNLRNMVITQKLSIPQGESIEHLAHVVTVSNLVQPNSATNQFLQKCLQSKDALSGAAQNKLWHIVENAGDKAQNIKGTSTYSNFAKQSRQIQQQHLQALQNLRQATR